MTMAPVEGSRFHRSLFRRAAIGLLALAGTALAQEPDPLPVWVRPGSGKGEQIRVVETDLAPRTVAGRHGLRVVSGHKEPIGQRIIEVPDTRSKTGSRGRHPSFIAYVPRGAIARGRKLVVSGAGGFPCAACHGPRYKGSGHVPALAGRSPGFIVRQLYDFKHGKRRGAAADMMQPQVVQMTAAMRADIAAYLASLSP